MAVVREAEASIYGDNGAGDDDDDDDDDDGDDDGDYGGEHDGDSSAGDWWEQRGEGWRD